MDCFLRKIDVQFSFLFDYVFAYLMWYKCMYISTYICTCIGFYDMVYIHTVTML